MSDIYIYLYIFFLQYQSEISTKYYFVFNGLSVNNNAGHIGNFKIFTIIFF